MLASLRIQQSFAFSWGLLLLIFLCTHGTRPSLEQPRGGEDQTDIDNEVDKPDGAGLVDTIPLDREEVQCSNGVH